MRAYVTSIGETTTELCVWSLKRLGFEVRLLEDASTTLWDKLNTIFTIETSDFLRVDADVIVNKNVLELIEETDLWWYQTQTFDWWKQDMAYGGVQFVRAQAIPVVRAHITEAKDKERPESYLFRLEEFHNPRVCGSFEKICGLNGYKQDDMRRVMQTKARRGQLENYDFDLAGRINQL